MAKKSEAPVATTRGRGPDGRYISVPVGASGAVATAPPPKRKPKPKSPAVTAPPAAPPVPQTAAPAVRLKNHIALVIDESGSMCTLRGKMVETVNSFIDVIRSRSQQADQDTTISLCVFSGHVRHPYIAADARSLQPMKLGDYNPNGGTALFDGVGTTIEKLEALKDSSDENTSFLILPITDGQENVSTRYNPRKLVAKLQELEGDGRWTVAFQLPKGEKAGFCRQFGIPAENVREWETSERGLAETTAATKAGVGGFFDARVEGKKKVDKFFVDLSKVNVTEVRKKLINVTSQFRILQVDKESPIKDFVESKTGKPYVLGSAYYELTKPEKVQPQKEVVIIERGKEKQGIFGGPAARDMLGLPQGEHAKLTVANLGSWRPCIKSTSPNRVLVRGTILLVDVTKITPDQSHFDTSVLDPR